MSGRADTTEYTIAARRQRCMACPRCTSVKKAEVQCDVAGVTVSLAAGRCRLRKWGVDTPTNNPSRMPVDLHAPVHLLRPNRLIVGVLSAKGEAYQARRAKCQETWLPVMESLGVEVVFLIGTGRTEHTPRLVLPGEHGRIGTELHLPCPDDYASLPQKTRGFCRWALANRTFDYLFKCDDDTYLVPDRLVGVDLAGIDYLGSEWTPGVGYASGGAGYFLSHDAAAIVASGLTQAEGAEDLLVGELLRARSIRFQIDERFVAYANADHCPRPDNDLITGHAFDAPWSLHEQTWGVGSEPAVDPDKNVALGLPIGYERRLGALPFDDTPWEDQYQDDVYRVARELCDRCDLTGVADIGCGSGYKLMKYFGHTWTVGVDLPSTVAWLRGRYPDRSWLGSEQLDDAVADAELVICADVIEHLADPVGMLSGLARMPWKYLVLSTPDRDLLYGSHHMGPPGNPYHVQEWNRPEFRDLVGRFFDIEQDLLFPQNSGSPCQVLVLTKRHAGQPDGDLD